MSPLVSRLPGLLVLAILAGLASCAQPPYALGSTHELLPGAPAAEDASYTADGRRIHYVEQAGGPARILFIHGTPGDWEGWAPLMRDARLRARATMIAVDRPGWGQSAAGGVVPDLAAQAALLKPLLARAPTLLVAHSYGGAVAAQLVLDDPQQVAGAVLIAPTLSPRLEQPHWYEDLGRWAPIEALLPRRLGGALDELAALPGGLCRLLPLWSGLRVPLALIQGEDDDQVDPRTVVFAQRTLPPGWLDVSRVRNQDHRILWRKPGLVVDAVLAVLRRVREAHGAGVQAGSGRRTSGSQGLPA